MRDDQGISDPSARNLRILGTGAILVTIGLSLLPFAGERFATFDACVANRTGNVAASTETLLPKPVWEWTGRD